MKETETMRGREEISARVHQIYCEQYEKDNGKPYWTNGDYSKLDERTKQYDRNIVDYFTALRAKELGEMWEKAKRACSPKWDDDTEQEVILMSDIRRLLDELIEKPR
jgi:hypothetical protein